MGLRAAILLTVGALTLLPVGSARAASTIRPDQSEAWGANVGWLNWRPDAATGVEVGQYVCSGFIYAANAGWINLGSGLPANGIRYQNSSASDFGVNVDSSGRLRGLAYGTNIGWVSFEEVGAPRLDLVTGVFSGWAYGANVGWINLGQDSVQLSVTSIAPGSDSDVDGIPDAWELEYVGNLTTLTRSGDADGDGQSDYDEYLADTDPTDPGDLLDIVSSALSPDRAQLSISWTSKPTRHYAIETSRGLGADESWTALTTDDFAADGAVTTRSVPVQGAAGFFRVRAVRPLGL